MPERGGGGRLASIRDFLHNGHLGAGARGQRLNFLKNVYWLILLDIFVLNESQYKRPFKV